jgi:hypothetical protein
VPKKARKAASTWAPDPQQTAVYRWEGSWKAWNREELTLGECRTAIRWACAQFDVAPPKVRQHASKEYPWYHTGLHVVSFSKRGKNVATALHEAAHVIVLDVFGDRSQDHGPTFLGVYLWLLTTAGVAPRVALEATARTHGLKWRRIDAEVSH